jgi:CubicO group peptidase (beta-lactamase class C family)
MFRYGDHGPATLGQIVEDVSGTSLNHYLHEHVFEPTSCPDSTPRSWRLPTTDSG